MSDYIITNGELYHYGVPGMKWGRRKAMGYAKVVDSNRSMAGKWDEKAQKATSKGKLGKASKYTNKADISRAEAAKYQQKIDKMAEKRYSKAGVKAGKADYYRDKANQEYQKHDRNAKVLEKAAKNYEKQGYVFRAEASRKAAAALRARGMNVREEQLKIAESYMKRSNKLNEKAGNFATATRSSLGKDKINSIINQSKKKGYDSAKSTDEYQRERELEERLGENGYAAYNRIRGMS